MTTPLTACSKCSPNNWSIKCTPAAASPSPETPTAEPGCTEQINFTSDAVVGLFANSTRAYWGPALNQVTDIRFEAGKTVWVLGKDSSGQFYKVLLSCSFLWVSVNSMVPNHDNVWRGAPLPTQIVSE
jgi:hypothetical protein